ncbi:MAG TPA: hypothetical protein VFE85_02435, partial [Woeseiaceae bacterium]|nr:hypothetical protein [Woeseiaceae bacterium]
MTRIATICACGAMLAWSADAPADFKTEYFDKLLQSESARLENVDDVLLTKEAMGWSRAEYYEKTSSVDINGERFLILNHVPNTEIQRRQAGEAAFANATPEQLESAAADIERAGRDAEAGIQQEIQESGFPPQLADMFMHAGDDPRTPQNEDQIWLSANPTDMGRMYGMMLRGAAEGKRLEAQMDAEERAAYDERSQVAAMMEY